VAPHAGRCKPHATADATGAATDVTAASAYDATASTTTTRRRLFRASSGYDAQFDAATVGTSTASKVQPIPCPARCSSCASRFTSPATGSCSGCLWTARARWDDDGKCRSRWRSAFTSSHDGQNTSTRTLSGPCPTSPRPTAASSDDGERKDDATQEGSTTYGRKTGWTSEMIMISFPLFLMQAIPFCCLIFSTLLSVSTILDVNYSLIFLLAVLEPRKTLLLSTCCTYIYIYL